MTTRTSIQRRLLGSLVVIFVAGIAVTGGIVYRQARDEANELFDLQLRQIAQSIPVRLFGSTTSRSLDDVGSGENVVVRIWNRFGGLVYGSHGNVTLPQPVQLGLTTVSATGVDWRVFAAITDGDLVLEVAQPISVRSRLAAEVALRTVAPLLILLPIMGALLWWVVGRGLAPLRRVAADVAARRPEALERLSADALPEEVAPLVESLNRLLGDLSAARDAQRAFIADAAHELRTPLTAVQLQLQIVERAEGQADAGAARAIAIDALRAGLQRASRLVEQLLALARAEPEIVAKSSGSAAPVDLVALASDAVAMHAELAHERGIDLGFGQRPTAPITVDGDRDALFTLLGNLIDNALRYTPRGGRVDVGVERLDDGIVLSVADDGPGIAPRERERVFDRFHRGDAARTAGDTRGSGLGLAIVRRVAERHGAPVELATPPNGHGLSVRVVFGSASTEAGDAGMTTPATGDPDNGANGRSRA